MLLPVLVPASAPPASQATRGALSVRCAARTAARAASATCVLPPRCKVGAGCWPRGGSAGALPALPAPPSACRPSSTPACAAGCPSTRSGCGRSHGVPLPEAAASRSPASRRAPAPRSPRRPRSAPRCRASASPHRHGCHEAGTGRRQRAIDSMGAVQPPPIRPPLVPLSTRPVGPLGPASLRSAVCSPDDPHVVADR